MSIEDVAWALNENVGDPLSKLVLIALANHTDHNHECFPSRKRIASYAECSIDTVDRRLCNLIGGGLIEKAERRTPGGDQTSNLYRLLVKNTASTTPAADSGHPPADSGHPAAKLRGPNRKLKIGDAKASPQVDRRLPTSEPAVFIANLFHRKLTTPWSEKEIKSFKKLQPFDMEELQLVGEYHEAERAIGGFNRRDIYTFLNNYTGEVDRARAWKSKPNATNGRSSQNRTTADRELSRTGIKTNGIPVKVL